MMKRSSRESRRTKKVIENERAEEFAKKGKRETSQSRTTSTSPSTRSRSREKTPNRLAYTELLQEKKNEKNFSSCIAERTKNYREEETERKSDTQSDGTDVKANEII